MYFKRIETDGLAHYSYMVGEGDDLIVIDPRRDVEIYIHEARKAGMKIKYIFETHRNEDYIIGSIELAEKTGATIYISGHEDLGHTYGVRIKDGFKISIGGLSLVALHTPGHTLGHMSYVLYEKDLDKAFMVFTGDCMFMGDLGRTDFYGQENLNKMTGLLYESIFEKLFKLGDHVIICPAHGPGSACGASMDDRPTSTLGYEKLSNPLLQVKSKEDFIEKFASMRIYPRYFEKMENLNVNGANFVHNHISICPLTVEEIISMEEEVLLIDIRSKESYFGGHIPGSIYFSKDNLTAYLGAIYTSDTKIAFIIDDKIGSIESVYWFCKRIGFDHMVGYLPEGIESWKLSGREVNQLETISAKAYADLAKKDDFIFLDVRDEDEIIAEDPEKNRINIPLKTLYKDFDKLDKNKRIYIFCGSGNRATTAASYLKLKGYEVIVITGGASMYRNL